MTTRSTTTYRQPRADCRRPSRRQLRGAGRRGTAARCGWTRCLLAAAVLISRLCIRVEAVHAVPLDQLIPGLFGGTLITTIAKSVPDPREAESQRLRFASQFNSLSAELNTAHSQAPVPSASGAFRFAWDPELDTFVRSTQSLGDGVAERASTLGRYTGTFNVTYTHIDFNTLEGSSLKNLTFSQSAFSPTFVSQLTPLDQVRFGNNVIQSQLNMGLSFDTVFLTGAFGVTDSIDVSMALSLSQAHLHATVTSNIIQNPAAHIQLPPGFFLEQNNRLVAKSGTLCGFDPQQPNRPISARCATDGFDQTAFGTGDLFLRSKWHFYDTEYADLAIEGVLTIPTGNADDFLGFNDPTFTPLLIASKDFGPVSPHLNIGYAFRSGADVSQAECIAGADMRATRWLTLAADFLGYFDDKRDGINDNVLQSAVGFRVNPFGKFVLGGTFQFPLNRDGIRADVIYSGEIEYTF